MAFDQSTRNRLQKFVADARAVLTEEFTRQMQNDYGLDPRNGTIAALDELRNLDDTKRETARILRETVEHYASLTPNAETADLLERIVREQAFTVLNRLAALRMAEARGFLIESLANGFSSKGFQLYSRVAKTGLGETGDVYRTYLFSLFDEFSLDLKVLFDRFSPFGRLFPREKALLDLLALINHHEIESLWAEDETVGWIYQYFNSKDERKKMRDESAAPRNSRELAVRNQFFTPRYVVEFLTDNTLGRTWYEMTNGETSLVEKCRYLVKQNDAVETPNDDSIQNPKSKIQSRKLKDPREITMLDPACGSMHFGLYAFDLFLTIYEEAWEMSEQFAAANGAKSKLKSLRETYENDKEKFLRDVPRLIIENNIHGVDIDPRAVQIAGLSLWLRAQRAWSEQNVKPLDRPQIRRSNIVCAEPMPGEADLLEEFVTKHFSEKPEKRLLGEFVRRIFDSMRLAGEAGSLLKIEEEAANLIADAREQWRKLQETDKETPFLFEGARTNVQAGFNFEVGEITDAQFWDRAESEIYKALRRYSEANAEDAAGYGRRLFADDAVQGFAFIDICRKKYDAILMNPPFGEVSLEAREILYKTTPSSAQDIFAAFVERFSYKLTEVGKLGAITSRLGFYKDWLTSWRIKFYGKPFSLKVFADLGYGVLDAALVEAAAYVIERNLETNFKAIFFNELDKKDKKSSLENHVEQFQNGEMLEGVNEIDVRLFEKIPNSIAPHWCAVSWLHRFAESEKVKSNFFEAKLGLATGDDFRFLRLVWEIHRANLVPTINWTWFVKGGEYEPYYGHTHLLSNWKYIKFARRATCSDFYGLAGATYTERTTSNLSVRVLPAQCIMSYNGPGIYSSSDTSKYNIIGVLNSAPYQFMIELIVGGGDTSQAGTAARHFMPSLLESLPNLKIDKHFLDEKVQKLIQLSVEHRNNEIREFFVTPFDNLNLNKYDSLYKTSAELFENSENRIIEATKLAEEVDLCVAQILHLNEHEISEIRTQVGRPFNKAKIKSERIEALEAKLNSSFIQDEEPESGRAVLKRSSVIDDLYETISHTERASIESIVSLRRENIKTPSWFVSEVSIILLSYLFGVAFGRWDVRYATGEKTAPELPDPFAPLPVCPPGMLQNAEGLPASPDDLRTTNYELRISWDGILVDDAGHKEDVENRLREVLGLIFKDCAEAVETEVCAILGVKSLRDYFLKPAGFFADHLKRYSKSRRQAPIYLPLSTRSGDYTLWLYYHRLTDQTLYTCVNDYVGEKLKSVQAELNILRSKPARTSDDEKRFEKQQNFAYELEEMQNSLLRLAAIWKPNLNDGVQITMSPLWKLFNLAKWQKTLKETWQKLEKGDYDWAHLAYSLFPERVREKCVKDKSLAIAHELEDLYIEPPAKIKKKSGAKKADQTALEGLSE